MLSRDWVTLSLLAALGCGATTTTPSSTPDPAPETPVSDRAPSDPAPSENRSSTPPDAANAPTTKPGLFDRGAAVSTLAASAERAAHCGGPARTSCKVVVVFEPDGTVSQIKPAPPCDGPPLLACITEAFRSAHVPAFEGSPIGVSRGVTFR